MKLTCLAIFLLWILPLKSQDKIENLNQFDNRDRKHGYWKIFVDEYWFRIEDTSNAKYCYYALYHHGSRIIGLSDNFTKNKYKNVIVETTEPKSDTIAILNGKYLFWINKELGYFHELLFDEGFMVYSLKYKQEYEWSLLEFNNKLRNLESSYYFTDVYSKKKMQVGYIYFLQNRRRGFDTAEYRNKALNFSEYWYR